MLRRKPPPAPRAHAGRSSSPGRAALCFASFLAGLATVTAGLVACETGGFKSKAPQASASAAASSPRGSGASDAGSSASGALGSSAASGTGGPVIADASPQTRAEHLVLRASYIVDAGVGTESSKIELEREGAFKMIRRAESSADPNDAGSECTGSLPPDVSSALWKAIDGAAFVPSESGFSKPVQAPRQQAGQAGQQARYSVTRMLADLSMVPSDENGARALIPPLRAAIATAEKQAASSGTCTKLQKK